VKKRNPSAAGAKAMMAITCSRHVDRPPTFLPSRIIYLQPAAPVASRRRFRRQFRACRQANRCRIFGDPARPAVCSSLQPSPEMCGESPDAAATQVHAMRFLAALERATT